MTPSELHRAWRKSIPAILYCCVFMWDKKLGKLLLRGIAQVELCRDSALIPFSSGYARS